MMWRSGVADGTTSGESVEAAVERVFREEYSNLVRLAFLMTRDASLADDLVEEAFVRVDETARALGVSTGTVKSQTFKALKLLRAELTSDERVRDG